MNLTFRQRADRLDKAGRAVIFLDVTWDGQRLPLPTGVKCKPEHFQEKKRVKISTKDTDNVRLNNKLASLEKLVTQVFTIAEGNEKAVTARMLQLAVEEHTPSRKKAGAPAAIPATFPALYEAWKLEHPGQGADAARRYKQVLGHLEAFQAGFLPDQLDKLTFYSYLGYLQTVGLSDGTISGHVKFLRACYSLREKAVPSWLKFNAKYGRPAALRRDELAAIWRLKDLPGHLVREQQRTMFQTLLLLRDSDLRKIKPHHVAFEAVRGRGKLPILRIYQTKTNEAVAFPLPPVAADIWKEWEGVVPVVSQQKRNLYIKELVQAAGLDRMHIRVRFKMGKPVEEPMPIADMVTTHTLRHTGADLVLWGSDGDANLKELALGHTVAMSIYGYDTLERYAPLLLDAWQKVWAAIELAHIPPTILNKDTITCPPTTFTIKRVPRAGNEDSSNELKD